MTLSDLERQEAKGQTVLEDLRNYTTTVLPGNTVITLCGEIVFLRGQDTNTAIITCDL